MARSHIDAAGVAGAHLQSVWAHHDSQARGLVPMKAGTPSAFSILVDIVGHDKAEQLRDRLGGETVYVPRRPSCKYDPDELREAFERVIARAESVTDAYQNVADELHVSARTVRRIVANLP